MNLIKKISQSNFISMSKIINENKLRLTVLGLLLFELLLSCPMPKSMSTWITTGYTISYDLVGFKSRILIGTIFDIFHIPINSHSVFIFIFTALILLILIVSHLIGTAFNSIGKEYNWSLLTLIVLYIASPGAISFLFHTPNFGRFEIYLIILSLISLMLIHKKKFMYIVPILSVICVLIHQVYVLTYFFIIFYLLFYELYRNKNKKKILFIIIITFSSTLCTFLILQFLIQKMDISELPYLIEVIREKVNIPISETMIKYEYFTSVMDFLSPSSPLNKDLNLRISYALSILFYLSPYFLLLLYIFAGSFCHSASIYYKLYIVLVALLPCFIAPVFIIAVDWGRWFGAFFTVLNIVLFYLIYKKDANILFVLAKLEKAVKKHPIYVFVLIFLLLSVGGRFGARTIILNKGIMYERVLSIFLQFVNNIMH